ncbi:MAG: hypothetical protein NUV68_06635 [Caldiserica bacterium]|nr:hypothetical protein [Caldisericota bacterium]MDH7562997.1 hypothetical protein [Caldisericota bacterium]
MNTAISYPLAKRAVPLKSKRPLFLNWVKVLFIFLIIASLAAQVIISVKTEEIRQKTQVLENQATLLQNKNLELISQISSKFNPQIVEKYARERLNMEFAIIAPQTKVVFLDEEDFQALAAREILENNGFPIP